VTDGLKLQVCRPGFVDSRDAILLADRINYGGANQELIWNVFARRGLGYSANQGLSTSRFDQVEAFDLPPSFLCQEPLSITAVPSNNVFTGGVPTTIYLGYGPQSVTLLANGDPTNTYSWSPAAGLSKTTGPDPVFTPTAPGIYTFTATAVNSASCTRNVSITITVIDVICGKKGEKISMCVEGIEECVNKNAVQGKLNEGASLGSCTSNATLAATDTDEVAMTATRVSNYPNPFHGATTLTFSVEHTGYVSLKVYDMVAGKEMATLFQGYAEAGVEYAAEFAQPTGSGGMYVYKLLTDDGVKSGTMVVKDHH
jgi:extracellular elastinolytic metalloproteinase